VEKLILARGLEKLYFRHYRAHMAHRLDNIARAGLALSAYHGCAFFDPAQRLAQIFCAADKGGRKLSFVDMMYIIGGGQNLALVDAVYAKLLQNLRLDKMPDSALRHYRYFYSLLDGFNDLGVAHSGNPAYGTNVRRDTLQRHYRNSTGGFGYFCLFGRGNIHYNAALQVQNFFHICNILIFHNKTPLKIISISGKINQCTYDCPDS
jgi:hypothetical protein